MGDAGQALWNCQGHHFKMSSNSEVLPGPTPGKVIQSTSSKSVIPVEPWRSQVRTRQSSSWVLPGLSTHAHGSLRSNKQRPVGSGKRELGDEAHSSSWLSSSLILSCICRMCCNAFQMSATIVRCALLSEPESLSGTSNCLFLSVLQPMTC